MFSLFISAFLIGIVFNAAPGAVFAETVRRGRSGGYRQALAVQLGSLLGDAAWAAFGLVGIGLLLQTEWLRWPVGIVGAAYLSWLAWLAWCAPQTRADEQAGASVAARNALVSGAMISLTNPQNVAYWAAIGGALAAAGIAEPQPIDYAIFFSGFMASSVIWCFLFAAVVGRTFRRQSRWTRFTNELCALGFLCLAAGSIYGLFQA